MGKLYSWQDITKIYVRGDSGEYVYIKEGSRVRHYAFTNKGLLEIGTTFNSIRDVYEQICKSSFHVVNYSINQDEINKRLMMMELVN